MQGVFLDQQLPRLPQLLTKLLWSQWSSMAQAARLAVYEGLIAHDVLMSKDVKRCKRYTGWFRLGAGWFRLGTGVFLKCGVNTCAQDLDSFTAAFHIEQ